MNVAIGFAFEKSETQLKMTTHEFGVEEAHLVFIVPLKVFQLRIHLCKVCFREMVIMGKWTCSFSTLDS